MPAVPPSSATLARLSAYSGRLQPRLRHPIHPTLSVRPTSPSAALGEVSTPRVRGVCRFASGAIREGAGPPGASGPAKVDRRARHAGSRGPTPYGVRHVGTLWRSGSSRAHRRLPGRLAARRGEGGFGCRQTFRLAPAAPVSPLYSGRPDLARLV